MEPEPSISGQAYFSTNGGKWAPQPVPAVRSHAIVRGDIADIDGHDEYLARLRRDFPDKCKEILNPPKHPHDIYDYFDGKDVSIHGLGYLRSLLDRIAWDNLHRIQNLESFVEKWMNNNGDLFWSLSEKPTVPEIFSQTDIDEYGKEWLEDSLERIWSKRDHEAANIHATHAQLPDRGNFHSDPEQWVRDRVNEDQMQNIQDATPKGIVLSVWAGNLSSRIQSHQARPQSGEIVLYPEEPPQPRPRRLPVPMPVSNDARVLEKLEARKATENQLNLASGNVNLALPVIPESSRSPLQEGYQPQGLVQNDQLVDRSLAYGPLATEQSTNPPYSSIEPAVDPAPAAGLGIANHQREQSVPRAQPLHANPLDRGPALAPLVTPTLPQASKPSNTRRYPMPYPSYYGPQPQPPQSPNYPLPSDGPLSTYQQRRSSNGQSHLSSQGTPKSNRRRSSASVESDYIPQQRDSPRRDSTDQPAFEPSTLWVGNLVETDCVESLRAIFREWRPIHISNIMPGKPLRHRKSGFFAFVTFQNPGQAAAAIAYVDRVKKVMPGGRELSVNYAFRNNGGQNPSPFYNYSSNSQQWNNPFNREAVPLPHGSQANAQRFPSPRRNYVHIQDPPRGAARPLNVGNAEVREYMGYRFNQPPALEATSLPLWSQSAAQLSKEPQKPHVHSPTPTGSHPPGMEAALRDHGSHGLIEHASSQAYNEHVPQPVLGDDAAANGEFQTSKALHEHQGQIEETSKSNLSRVSKSSPGPNELGVTTHDFASEFPNSIAESSYGVHNKHIPPDAPFPESPTQSIIDLSKAVDAKSADLSTIQTLTDRPDSKSEQTASIRQTEEGLDPGSKDSKGGKAPGGSKNKAKARITTEGPSQSVKQPPTMDITNKSSQSAADRPMKNGQPGRNGNQARKIKRKQQRASSILQEANVVPLPGAASASQTFAQKKPMSEVMNNKAVDRTPAEGSATQEMTRGDSSSSHDAVQTPAQGVMSTQPTTYAPSEVSEAEILASQEQRVIAAGYHGHERKQTCGDPATAKEDASARIYEAGDIAGQSEDTTRKEHPQDPKQSLKRRLPVITPAVPDFNKMRQLHRDEQRLQRIQQRLESVTTDEIPQSRSAEKDDSEVPTSLSTKDKAPSSLPGENFQRSIAHAELKSIGSQPSPSFERGNTAVEEEALYPVEDTTIQDKSSPNQAYNTNFLVGSATEEASLNTGAETKRPESKVASNDKKVGPSSSTEAEAPAGELKPDLQGESKAEAMLNPMPTGLQDAESNVARNIDGNPSRMESDKASVGPISTHKKKQKGLERTPLQNHLASSESTLTGDDDLGPPTCAKDAADISQEKQSTELEPQRQGSPDVGQEQSGSHTASELGEEQQAPASLGAGTPTGSVRRKKKKNKSKKKKAKSPKINTPDPEKPYNVYLNAGNLPAPEMPYKIESDNSTAGQARNHARERRLETFQEQINPHFVSFSRAADDYYAKKNATYLPFFPYEMNSAQPVGNDNEDPDPQDDQSSSKLSPKSRAEDLEQAMKDCGYIVEETIDEEAIESDDEMSQDDYTEQTDKPQPESMFTSNELTALSALCKITRSTIIENHGDQDRAAILNELPADIVENYIEGSLTHDSTKFKSLDEPTKAKVKRLSELDLREAYIKTLKEDDDHSNDLASTPDDDHFMGPNLETKVQAIETPISDSPPIGMEGGESSGTRSSTRPQKENQRPTIDDRSAASRSSLNIHATQVLARIKHGDGSEEVVPTVEENVLPTVVKPDRALSRPPSKYTALKEEAAAEKAAKEIKVPSIRPMANFIDAGVIYIKIPGTDSRYRADYELHEDDEAFLNTKEHHYECVTRNGAIVWKREGFDEKAHPSEFTMKVSVTDLALSEVQPLEDGDIVQVSAQEASSLRDRQHSLASDSDVPVPNYFGEGLIYTKIPSTSNKYTVVYKLQQGDELVLNYEDKCFDFVIRDGALAWVRQGLVGSGSREAVKRAKRFVFSPWSLAPSQYFDVGDVVEVKQPEPKNGNGKKRKRENNVLPKGKEKEKEVRPFVEKLPPQLESYLPVHERGRSTGRRLGDLLWGVPRGEPAWGSGGDARDFR